MSKLKKALLIIFALLFIVSVQIHTPLIASTEDDYLPNVWHPGEQACPGVPWDCAKEVVVVAE